MVDAYFTFFWTNGPLVLLAVAAILIADRRNHDYTLLGIVFANFCISGPLLLLQLGSQSPISKALGGLLPSERPRALGWFFVILGLMLGLGLVIPFLLHLATYISLHRNGIKIHLLGLNRREINLQLGSLGRQELEAENARL
ncbi:MAG TPA: hypothetical protein VK171_10420 [Fimbriimonas sp.]|nr:hypothetical protein [Fimbriimonas sp.]